MEHQYRLLNENSGILECYDIPYAKLASQYSEKGIISRTDVLAEFNGESLKKIMHEEGFSGDVQKGIDMLVHDLLVAVDEVVMEDSEIIETLCPLNKERICERTDKSMLEYHGRKLCGKREYSIECRTLILRRL